MTNFGFESWKKYLGDPPLPMAMPDPLVDGAIILKLNGKPYRAHGAQPAG